MNFRNFILGLITTIKEVKNWQKALFFRLGLVKTFDCNFKSVYNFNILRYKSMI
ncbi:MAG: hypothetical protein LBC39_04060 [Methanobrevibacter sp.]|jgi:hypothetical protein|nr:hypothetical protein [Candidatus Methanovirga aequatorialis]